MNLTATGTKPNLDILRRWIDLLGASRNDIRSEFGKSRFRSDEDSSYGALTSVALMGNKDALFYFDEDRLILIHIHSKALLTRVNGHALLSELGSPAADLRSRAGKGFSQYIFPERGIAFSSDSAGRVAFVEIFQPMSLDEYQNRIYIDPGLFVK